MAFLVHQDNSIGRSLDRETKFFLSVLLGRNVHRNAAHSDRLILIKLDPTARGNPPCLTIRTYDTMFAFVSTVARDCFAHRCGDSIAVVWVQRLEGSVGTRFLEAVETGALATFVCGPDFIAHDVPFPQGEMCGFRGERHSPFGLSQLGV